MRSRQRRLRLGHRCLLGAMARRGWGAEGEMRDERKSVRVCSCVRVCACSCACASEHFLVESCVLDSLAVRNPVFERELLLVLELNEGLLQGLLLVLRILIGVRELVARPRVGQILCGIGRMDGCWLLPELLEADGFLEVVQLRSRLRAAVVFIS